MAIESKDTLILAMVQGAIKTFDPIATQIAMNEAYVKLSRPAFERLLSVVAGASAIQRVLQESSLPGQIGVDYKECPECHRRIERNENRGPFAPLFYCRNCIREL